MGQSSPELLCFFIAVVRRGQPSALLDVVLRETGDLAELALDAL